jgi:hypothetical protein
MLSGYGIRRMELTSKASNFNHPERIEVGAPIAVSSTPGILDTLEESLSKSAFKPLIGRDTPINLADISPAGWIL